MVFKKQNYFDRERVILKILGLSLAENETLKYRMYSCLLLIFVDFLPALQLRFSVRGDFDTQIHSLIFLMSLIMGVIKGTTILRNRVKVRRILNILEHDLFITYKQRSAREVELMEQCTSITKLQGTCFWILVTGGIVGNTILECIVRLTTSDYKQWKHPFGHFMALNETYSPSYEIGAAYQAFSLLIIGMQFATFDVIIAAMLCHITYHFRILLNIMSGVDNYERMRRITVQLSSSQNKGIRSLSGNKYNFTWVHLRRIIKNTVEHHVAIVKIAQEVEELCSIPILCAFIATLITLGLSLYSILILNTYKVQKIFFVAVGVGWCLQLGLYCYWGEQITHESQQIERTALVMNYVGRDSRHQQALIMIIRRSQSPILIKAGKVIKLSLHTLLSVFRGSYSAFAVIHAYKTEDE